MFFIWSTSFLILISVGYSARPGFSISYNLGNQYPMTRDTETGNLTGNLRNGTCNTTDLQNNCNNNCNCNPTVTCAPPVNETEMTFHLLKLVRDQQDQIRTLLSLQENCYTATVTRPLPRDCQEVRIQGQTSSGAYDIYPSGKYNPVQVYCDMETPWEGWTVIQRREDGSVNFDRGWEDYSLGFGNVNSEHWLGNANIHQITAQGRYELRIELEDWAGNTATATYDKFRVGESGTKFKLILGQFRGEAGDGLSGKSYQTFSTSDDEQLRECEVSKRGGWWGFDSCHESNLNGNYYDPNMALGNQDGVVWKEWKGEYYSLKGSEMKIRSLK